MVVADTTDADIAAGQMGAVTVTANGGGLLGGAVTSGSIGATTASTIATVGGAAAGGFTGGALSSAAGGGNIDQVLSAGATDAIRAAVFALAGCEFLNIQSPTQFSWSDARNALVTSAARYGVNAFAERQFGING